MTALKEYDRLETTGLWRESLQAQRRDVLVSFGEASLIISDRNDTALTHWSLAAVTRQNPGARPAIFHPGDDTGEELELEDPAMIDAIEKVRHTIDRRRPKAGRLRAAVLFGIIATIAALGLFWLPGALTRHTVTVVPDEKRISIGSGLLRHLTKINGSTCRSARGTVALARLGQRSVGGEIRRIHILPNMSRDTLVLPGRILLMSPRLVEDHETPDVAAGHILKSTDNAIQSDPLKNLLHAAGLRVTFRLLTTGQIPDDALAKYAEALLASPETEIDANRLLQRFEAANISSTSFAYAKDISGETVLPLIEADPFRGVETPQILSDEDWLSLQDICRGT